MIYALCSSDLHIEYVHTHISITGLYVLPHAQQVQTHWRRTVAMDTWSEPTEISLALALSGPSSSDFLPDRT
jgi:hypothetical protein